MEAVCRVCDAVDPSPAFYDVREMMFGLREAFRYFQCEVCGCLQIQTIPGDLSRFYPTDYYAHRPYHTERPALKNRLRRWRNAYAFTGRGVVGRALNRIAPCPHGEPYRWMRRSGLRFGSSILDVGCGYGALLSDLREHGYHNLLGIDPYIETDLEIAGGVRILRTTLERLEGSFEFIMLHHSLEHIPDQQATFRSIHRLLEPGGKCLIRIPVASSHAWEEYRENWVQLDAPRHFYLHTVDSLELAARRAALDLLEVQFDSTEFQFVGSEMYRRDIPLAATSRGLFSRSELARFRRAARALNAEGRGDSAVFLLRR